MRRERGSILILALWAIAMLAILAVTLGAGTRQKLTLMQRLYTAGTLHAAAESGVEKARGFLRQPDINETFDSLRDDWAVGAAFQPADAAGASFWVGQLPAPEAAGAAPAYGLVDEDRKLNLNTAGAESIYRLLKLVSGLDEEDELRQIAFGIVDWRDEDSTYSHPEFGAEDDDYHDLKPPRAAKDGPFEALEELLLVKGMTRAIFDKIRPFVTIFGGDGVNANTAGREVLVASGLSDLLAGKVLAYRAGTDGQAGNGDDLYFAQAETISKDMDRFAALPSDEQAVIENLVSTGVLRTSSGFFEALSHAKLDSGRAEMEIRAVIDRHGKIHAYRVSKVQWLQPS
jgi:general secretion pathway protein K